MAKVYAGLFDDRFDKYPNGYPRNEKFHEDNLINSLLLGDTLYINDGYVFQHPQLVKWLEQGENTLLYQMCQFGYVKFLQRDQNVEFWRMNKKVKGVPSLRNAIVSNGVESTLKSIVKLNDAKSDKILVPWPSYNAGFDIGKGFVGLMEQLRNLAVYMKRSDTSILKRVYDDFSRQLSIQRKGPRTIWENVVLARYPGKKHRSKQNQLMCIANVCYHLNMVASLKAFSEQYDDMRIQTVDDVWGAAEGGFSSQQGGTVSSSFDGVKELLEGLNEKDRERFKGLVLEHPLALRADEFNNTNHNFVCSYLENTDLRNKRIGVSTCIEKLNNCVSSGAGVVEALDKLVYAVGDYNQAFKTFAKDKRYADIGGHVNSIISPLVSPFLKTRQSDSELGKTCVRIVLSQVAKRALELVTSATPGLNLIYTSILGMAAYGLCTVASSICFNADYKNRTKRTDFCEVLGYRTTYQQKPLGTIFESHEQKYRNLRFR